MIRLRIVLLVVMGILGYGAYWLTGTDFRLHIFLALLGTNAVFFTSAFIIFISSFVQMDVLPNGQYCYNPNNFYWRIMNHLYSWGNAVSLCKAYWLTVLSIVIPILAVAALIGVGKLIYLGFVNPLYGLGILFGGAWAILAVWGFISFGLWLDEKLPWLPLVIKSLFALVAFFALVVAPIYVIMDKDGVSIWRAILTYLEIAGLVIGTIAVALGIILGCVYIATRWTPSLKHTLVAETFFSVKKETCPILIACPLASEKNR